MAAAFIGCAVEVKLKPPQSWELRATVVDIVDGRLDLGNGAPLPDFSVQGSQIEDIEIAKIQPSPFSNIHTSAIPGPQLSEDPAILSYARSPVPQQTNSTPPSLLKSHSIGQSHNHSATIIQASTAPALTQASPLTPNRAASVELDDQVPPLETINGTARITQKQRGRHTKRGPHHAVNQSSPELPSSTSVSTKTVGWRQTPLLKEIPPSKKTTIPVTIAPQAQASRPSLTTVKRKTKKERALEIEAQRNGWATEDATDVQEMPEFDFEANLSRFDKRAVFQELRDNDTTADEDRLVSFNRVDRKLRPTENVLEKRPSNKDSDSMNEDYEVAFIQPTSARMVRNQSRQSLRGHPPLRRDSSMMTDGRRSISQSKFPELRTNSSPAFRDFPSPLAPRRPVLRYDTTDKICPTVLPETLSTIEAFALADPLHLSTDVLTENAGRCIAEMALSAINPGGRRIGSGNTNARPVIVILASDNECGSRAIAAAVHLRERGVRCIASVVGLGQDPENLDPTTFSSSLGYQLRRFEGRVMPWIQTAAFLKTLDAPPELIIDGILDIHTKPADLAIQAPGDLKEIMEMMAWANKSKASCLAIDLPSGIDAITGEVQVYEGEPAEIRAKLVLACGIPTAGLLKALELRRSEGFSDDWRCYVADIGLNPALRRFGMDNISAVSAGGASRRGVRLSIAFGANWIVPVRFDDGEGPSAGDGI